MDVPQADLIGRSLAELTNVPVELDDRLAVSIGNVACQGGTYEFHQYSQLHNAWYHVTASLRRAGPGIGIPDGHHPFGRPV